MKIGVPAEVKPQEGHSALAPVGSSDLVRHGHEVLVPTFVTDQYLADVR